MRQKIISTLIISLGLLIFAGVGEYKKLPNGKLLMVFCDVGQGDAQYLRTPDGKDILIDGGPNDKVLTCLNNHMNFWDRKIELLVLTHPQADHSTGLISVLKNYQIDTFLIGPEGNETEQWRWIEEFLRNHPEIRIANPAKDDVIKVGSEVEFKTVWPTKTFLAENIGPATGEVVLGAATSRDVNDFSLVLQLNYNNKKALFTGDITETLLSNLEDIDLLKVPHHGSKTGLSKSFFEETRPEIAVIEVGKDNKFGHPTKEVLDELSSLGAQIHRTDLEGEVVVEW